MANWNQRWIDYARFIATWSKDRKKKVGAVIVDKHDTQVSHGWNGFPRKLNDNVDARHERPAKYKWCECAERNAIYNAARKGHATEGCIMYVTYHPCAQCARAIIQSGIEEVFTKEPNWNHERWGEDFKIAKQMFEEVGVKVHYIQDSEESKN